MLFHKERVFHLTLTLQALSDHAILGCSFEEEVLEDVG